MARWRVGRLTVVVRPSPNQTPGGHCVSVDVTINSRRSCRLVRELRGSSVPRPACPHLPLPPPNPPLPFRGCQLYYSFLTKPLAPELM